MDITPEALRQTLERLQERAFKESIIGAHQCVETDGMRHKGKSEGIEYAVSVIAAVYGLDGFEYKSDIEMQV